MLEAEPYDIVAFTALGHVPQVNARAVEPLALPFGIATTLSFNGWLDLEGIGAWDWQAYYGAQQTFVGASLERECSSEDVPLKSLVGRGGMGASLCWLLLTVTFDTFLLHPNLSCGYAMHRRKDNRRLVQRARGFGDLECFQLPVLITLQPDHVEVLTANAQLVDSAVQSELGSVVGALGEIYSRVLSTRGLDDVLMDFVGQLEFFLNPLGDGPLQQTFSERFALVCARHADEIPVFRKIGKAFYGFRSDTLHAQRPDRAKFVDAVGQHYPFPSMVLRRCIEFIAYLCDQRTADTPLSLEAFLQGDRTGLTEAYVTAGPRRLQTFPPQTRPLVEDDSEIVDAEISVPVGSEQEAAALLASLGATKVADD